MAEINNVIAEASQDLQTIEDFVNLPADSEVYPRLLPSVNVGTLAGARQAIFKAGGLPATPFATKALMTASALIDGQYAQVTDDAPNSGLYIKKSGAWVKSEYDPFKSLTDYVDALPEYADINDFSVFGDMSHKDNLIETRAKKLTGYFISTTGKAVGANPEREAVVLKVTPSAYYVFNRRANEVGKVYVMGKSTEIGVGTTGLVAIPTTMSVGVNNVVKIPEGINYIVFNSILSELNIYEIDGANPVLKVAEFKGELVSYAGANIADVVARQMIQSTVKKDDLTTKRHSPLESYTPLSGFYIATVSVSEYAGGELFEYQLEPNKTYSIYYGGNYAEGNNWKAAGIAFSDVKLTSTNYDAADVIVPEATDDPNIKTFRVPEGKFFTYVSVKLKSGVYDYDARQTVTVAEGLNDPRDQVAMIDKYPLRDDIARKQIDDIINGSAVISPLKSKKIAIIGDSITADSFRANKGWGIQLSERVGGMDLYNYGISNTGFFDRQDVVSTMADVDFDYIVINLGSNDAQTVDRGLPLGEWKDATPDTLHGAIYKVFREMREKYPLAKIVIFTPIPRKYHIGEDGVNRNGYSMRDLADILIRYANHFSYPHLDMLRNSGLDPSNPVQNETYFKAPSYAEGDGVHPNDAGFARMVDRFLPFLESV